MPLASGTQLGPYEITAPLGAGGMGEVYRARDTRLERTVAIKILPAQFSSDPVRKQRFEREAKTISSLNHPHICVLYDVGHQDGVDYLVMECVEGETLAKRLEKGPLPVDQTLKYGAQVADALDKAHRSGIVHRDLKPGNIILTPTGAKLLDFGLAKPAVPLATAATLTAAMKQSPVTEQGTIVGTFQYMSPEQVEGKDVDGRSDIFSLGAVLHEMVTGKRAFEGKSQLSVASAILEKEPEPISAAKPMTPPALEHAVKKCLAKLPDERWQSASDLASELKWIAEGGSEAGAQARALTWPKTWDRAGWLVAALLSLLVASGGVLWWVRSRQIPPAMHFYSPVPFPANDVALSPDGRTLAMVAYSDQANKYVIWTYEVGSTGAAAVQGTEGASHPFWSPDRRFIGFFANGKLKRVDVTGGSAQVLCDAPHGRGGAWNREGTILFSPEAFGGLSQVSSAGGTPTEVTKPDASRSETSHRWPVFLPDGRHFLYLAANFSGEFEKNAIFLGSLDSGERRLIVSASSNAAFADPGYLLYLRDNALVAQRFDSHSYALSGEPRTVSDEVQYLPQTDLALFDVTGKGTLVTQTGKGAAKSQLKWFDRSGRSTGIVGPPGAFANPSLSPDGRRVAFDQGDTDGRRISIWIHELTNGAVTRFTFGSWYDQLPIWSSDGRQVTFSSNRKGYFGLYQKNADGSGPEQEIANLGVQEHLSWGWSHDGKYLLLGKNAELWYMSFSDRQAKPFLQAKWIVRNAQFSPDGRWVAYASNETGNWEVYVSPFPSANSKWQLSKAGGEEPRWRQDGKELFYVSADGKMMAVPVKTANNFEAGPPVTLFQTHLRQPISYQDAFFYDVTSDGQKFLINTRVDEPNAAPLSIILNWASEMER
jgi:serine/threonine protein kinase/Tol biopolymer transport system component